ncbi:MAG: NMD3-related protein [archaeon]
MPDKFCPKCGAEDTDFYDGLCLKCYKEEEDFVETPEKIKIKKCRECGCWQHKGKWEKPNEDILKEIIKKQVDIDLNYSEIEVDLKEDKVKAKIRGNADPKGMIPVELEIEMDVDVDEKLCSICLRRKGGDHRVKIQLRKNRGKKRKKHNPKKFKEVKRYIEKTTLKEMGEDNKAMAAWRTKGEKGWDYYYGYRKIGKSIVDRVSKKYDLKPKTSKKDAGYDESGKRKKKDIYCFRV